MCRRVWFAFTFFLAFCQIDFLTCIDGQLMMSSKTECYERVYIGSHLPKKYWLRPPVLTNSLRECQSECSIPSSSCQGISFGVSPKGNGSCELSTVKIESNDLKNIGLIPDPDYDIYTKRKNCDAEMQENEQKNGHDHKNIQYYSANASPDVFNVPNASPNAFNDPSINQEVPTIHEGRPVVYYGDNYIQPQPNLYYQLSYEPQILDHNPLKLNEFVQPDYVVALNDMGRPFERTEYKVTEEPNFVHKYPNSEVITSSPGAAIPEMQNGVCFRRLLAGKRVSPDWVLRRVSCEQVEDCQRECGEERRFDCEGFNYRLDPSGRGQGECELTSKPLSHLDMGRDFYPDKDYDYYERDRNSLLPDCRGSQFPSDFRNGEYLGDRGPPNRGYGHHSIRESERPDYVRHSDHRTYAHRTSYGQDFDQLAGNHHTYENRHDYQPLPDRDHINQRPYSEIPRPILQDNDFRDVVYYERPIHDRPIHDRTGYDRPINDGSTYYRPIHDRPIQDRPVYDGSVRGYDRPIHDRPTLVSHRDNEYVPYVRPESQYWGAYGGSYGHGQTNHIDTQRYAFWGLDAHNRNRLSNDNYGVRNRFENTGYPFNYYALGSSGPKYNPWGISGEYGQGLRDGHTYLPETPVASRFHGLENSVRNRYPEEGGYRHSDQDYGRGQQQNYECSRRAETGFRLDRSTVRRSQLVPNIDECEKLCQREPLFKCHSFGYRYSIPPHRNDDNCHLTDKSYRDLDHYTDLQPDRDFDIYAMTDNSQTCGGVPSRSKFGERECFLRIRSGQRLSYAAVRDSLVVPSIGECEVMCIRSKVFTCRSFSYRYGSPTIGGTLENCQLSDWPFSDLDMSIHLVPDPGYELYERGSYGRGCEIGKFGVNLHRFEDPHIRPDGHPHIHKQSDQLCYLGYEFPARLLPTAIRRELNVPTERDCKTECSNAREFSNFRCMSFSYRSNGKSSDPTPNCELSDIDQRDLRLSLDYEHQESFWLFAWNIFDERCEQRHTDGLYNHIIHKIGVAEGRDNHDPSSRDYTLEHRSKDGGSDGLDTWEHYTVSGWPCRRNGGGCEQNKVTGFFSCELEFGEIGSWDYCCAPNHPCGYSEGYNYPWCYVGQSKTQWRICKDHYYPYGSSSKPQIIQNSRPRPTPIPEGLFHDHHEQPNHPIRRPFRPPNRVWNNGDRFESQHSEVFLDPPKPGGFGEARYWPVAYLHSEGPPNSTTGTTGCKSCSSNHKSSYAQFERLLSTDRSNDKIEAIDNLIESIRSGRNRGVTIDKATTNSSVVVIPSTTPSEAVNFDVVENVNTSTKTTPTANNKIELASMNFTNKFLEIAPTTMGLARNITGVRKSSENRNKTM